MLLRTLGELVLHPAGFGRPKPLLLLAYLALEGPRERRFLSELFWPDAADPRKSLTVALARLRRAAPQAVEADGSRLAARVDADVAEFSALLAKGRRDEALALYRGPFAEGADLPGWGAELEEWVYRTREYFEQRAVDASLDVAEREAAQGRIGEASTRAVGAYRLARTTVLEAGTLDRLHTLLRAGSDPLAADVAAEAEALGARPVGSVREARRRLRAQPGPAANPALHAPATAFVGRDLEVTEVGTLLTRRACRLLTLVGPAGVGKSRLAAQAAREQLQLGTFPDGVRWVPLAHVASAAGVGNALVAALGLEPDPATDPLAQATDYLAGRGDVLLVFDDAEQVAEEAWVLSELARRCPNATLLATSRQRFDLADEHVFPLSGLAVPDGVPEGSEAARFDAVQLFVQRAQQARPDVSLDDVELPHVLTICRAVDGLPLALELAAAWVRVSSCADIAREIERNLDLLATSKRDVPERHRSLRGAFEQAWAALTAGERAVARRASVFRGGFRREAARAVADATIPVLATLVDRSLLRLGRDGRFEQHPLLRQFALEKLADAHDERERTEAAHARFYGSWVATTGAAFAGERSAEALAEVETELPNVEAAWIWAARRGRVAEVADGIGPLTVLFDVRNRAAEGAALFASVLELLEADVRERDPDAARVRCSLASLRVTLGDHDGAEEAAGRALPVLEAASDRVRVVTASSVLGATAWRRGAYDAARQRYRAALTTAREDGDAGSIARCLGNLALVERALGDAERARDRYREALELTRRRNDPVHLVRYLNNLANVHLNLDEPDAAEPLLREGLELSARHGGRDMVPYLRLNLGLVALQRGDPRRAAEAFDEGLEAAREAGDPSVEALAHVKLGSALAATQPDRAVHAYATGIRDAHALGELPIVLEGLTGLALLRHGLGDTTRAEAHLRLAADHPATDHFDRVRAQRALQASTPARTGPIDLDTAVAEAAGMLDAGTPAARPAPRR